MDNQTISPQIAKTAARWWADQLRGDAKLDNGDSSPMGGVTFAMATMLQQKEKQGQTDEAIDKFEAALEELVSSGSVRILDVDYDPCRNLRQAAATAGLNLGKATLPWKTTMWIDEKGVEVRSGYGAGTQTLPLVAAQ